MWRLVETIRNKSTILKSRKLNMERIGQPSAIHMEIIEEDVVQEGFGTDFKKKRRICIDDTGGKKSNRSSPTKHDVIQEVNDSVEVIDEKKERFQMEVLKKIENQFRHYDVDSHADPPSKSEPPSALPFDETLSVSFFQDLESPSNHPPLRYHHTSFQGKSKEEIIIDTAEH